MSLNNGHYMQKNNLMSGNITIKRLFSNGNSIYIVSKLEKFFFVGTCHLLRKGVNKDDSSLKLFLKSVFTTSIKHRFLGKNYFC